MNIATMLALLQTAASLLASAQNPQATPASMQKAVNLAGNAIQAVVQAKAPINFSVKENDGIWPNIDGLLNAPYLDSKNDLVRLGKTVLLVTEYTSFGDINNDGLDDAAVVVNKPDTDGTAHYFLAAMLNHGNILFNIADLSLGNSVNIDSHRVIDGKIVIDGRKYELLGKELRSVL
jgi:hypothetical protein